MTHAERLVWLAERFPMLRSITDKIRGADHALCSLYGCQGVRGSNCQGRGWVPERSLQAVLKAVFTFPDVQVVIGESEGRYSVLLLRTVGEWKHPKAWGKTINEAIIAALYEAAGGKP